MPSHKLACPEGVLHARISDVHHVLTVETIRKLFCRSGDGYVICAFEQVVNGMYGVEAYVEFRSRWRADRARDALDGHAIYDGCCILAVDLAPPIYTTITMPDDDELAPAYFYDDTPYAEWAAALAAAERHDEAPAPGDELQIVSEIDVTAVTPVPVVVAASAVAVLPPNAATPFVREDDLHLEVSTGAIGAPLSTALRETDPVVETHTTCSTVCLGSDSSATMTPSSPMASSVSTPASPLTVSAASMGPAVGDLLEGGDDLTSRSPSVCLMLWPPWPPPWYVSFQDVIKCKNTIHGFILESLQLMLWATKNPWPPPFPNRNTVECIKGRIEIRLCCFTSQGAELFLFCYEACGISNLHSTLYIKQISGDWYLRRTIEFELDATLNLILFTLGVQCEQLQPTMFQRSALSCYDTQYLIASTNVDMMLDLLLVRRAICTLWTCRYIDNLQCSSGSTTLAILRLNPHFSLLMQCSFIHSQLQSAFWFYIPGHILFSCWACSDFGGSGHVTSKSKPPDIKLQVWLSCFIGHIIQCCFELLQRKIAWPFNLEGHKCVCCLLGTYDQEGLHYCIGTVGVQLHFGCPVEAACLPFPEGYLHGMVQVISSLVHNYMGRILVVLSIAHNAMDMIIGWESRSMACITWIKENVPTQLLEHYLCPTRPHASISVSRLIDDNFSYVLVLVQELDSMLFFFSLGCITIQPTKDTLHLQQAKNTFDFLQPAGPPTTCDTCSLLMAHGWLDVLTCGVLLVQLYSGLVQVITCPRNNIAAGILEYQVWMTQY